MLAAVVAAEETHAVGQEHGAGSGGANRERVAVEHSLDLGLAADAAAIFRFFAEADQIGGAILPGFAAVAAAHRAVGFERRVDVAGRIRIDVEPHDPAGEAHDYSVGQTRIRRLAPGVAAVIAAVDTRWRGAGIDGTRVLWVDAHRPDVGIPRQVQLLPARAAIGAAVGTLGGADIDHVGVLGMNRYRMHLGVVW